MLLPALGIVVQGAGLTVLFLHWRARGGLGGGALLAGWALIAAGMAPWLLAASPEKALALGALAPMIAGLALLAPDAWPRLVAGKVRRARAARTPPAEAEEAIAAGRASRNAARWVGALVAAPALSAAALAAWLAYAPVNIVNAMLFGAFLLAAVFIAALLWLLAAVQPWRNTAWSFGAAAFLAAIAAAGAN